MEGLAVGSGGREIVFSGGIDRSATVRGGGVEYVSSGAVAEARGVLYRPVERVVLARLGSGNAGGDDHRLYASDKRVHDAVPGHQLSCLQQLLQ
jgi:autotransporter passenger strand-loop-strand repeat protein